MTTQPSPSCTYAAEAGRRFLEALHPDRDGWIELRALHPDRDRPTLRHWISQPGDEAETVSRWMADSYNVYVGVAARRRWGGDSDALLFTCHLHAEIDLKDYGQDFDALLAKLRRYPLPPSLVIFSGGGLHVYWRIARYDLTTRQARERLKAVLTRLIADVGAGRESKDPARILRLAGTTNFKYLAALPRVEPFPGVETTDRVYRLDDFPLPPQAAKRETRPLPSGPRSNRATPDELLRRALSVGGRNKGGLWLAAQLRDNQFSEPEAEGLMARYAAACPALDHPYAVEEALKTCRSVYASPARAPWGSGREEEDAPAERPERPADSAPGPEPAETTQGAQEGPQGATEAEPGGAGAPDADAPAEEAIPAPEERGLSLCETLEKMNGRLRRLGVRVGEAGLTFRPDMDVEDIHEAGRVLAQGAGKITTALNFGWADWYAALGEGRGRKVAGVRKIYRSELKVMSEQKRLSDLAAVAKKFPPEQRAANLWRPWSFFQKVAGLPEDRRVFWCGVARHGMMAEIDAELEALHCPQRERLPAPPAALGLDAPATPGERGEASPLSLRAAGSEDTGRKSDSNNEPLYGKTGNTPSHQAEKTASAPLAADASTGEVLMLTAGEFALLTALRARARAEGQPDACRYLQAGLDAPAQDDSTPAPALRLADSEQDEEDAPDPETLDGPPPAPSRFDVAAESPRPPDPLAPVADLIDAARRGELSPRPLRSGDGECTLPEAVTYYADSIRAGDIPPDSPDFAPVLMFLHDVRAEWQGGPGLARVGGGSAP